MPTPNLRSWRSHGPAPISLSIEPGTRRDLEALAPLHYRAGPPATIDRVLRAVDTDHDTLAGVLVTSRPTLNGAWRRGAWSTAFSSGNRSRDAHTINAHLRTISRVIVDPRFRGLSVGSGLVRTYLAAPATVCTEAITALGDVCPFFERAGMRRLDIPAHPRTARLLRSIGTSDANQAARVLTARTLDAQLERALRIWARANASTRRIAEGDPRTIASAAAGALLAPPTAYAHGTPPHNRTD